MLVNMYELKDTVVLITGGANGIGAAFVKILVEHGTKHVTILDTDETAGVNLKNELNAKYGDDKVKFIKCDVANDEELFKAFKDTMEERGYIDLVINNAGVTNESNSTFIRKEIEINVAKHRIQDNLLLLYNKNESPNVLTALVNGTIKALELMRKDKGGRGGTVINVSSVASLIKISPLLFVYAATKSAVLQFSNCIGLEPYHSKTGVRIITVCYGPTNTSIMKKLASFDEGINMQELAALYPMQSVEVAAQGTLEAFRRGESGSTWLINNGKPAKDITANINKAYAELSKVLEDD